MKYLPFSLALFLLPSPVFSDVWTFETPSENIQCVVGQDVGVLSDISCTIIEKSGPPAKPRPNNCREGWGHTFSMREKGPVEMGCQYPSTDKSAFDRADYGVTGNFGGFTCHSSTKGLECTNRDGNGFFLSRRNQYVIGDYRGNGDSAQPVTASAANSASIGYYPAWGAEFGQGIVEAGVGDGKGSELRLVCNISGLDTIASRLTFGPQSQVPAFAPAGSTVEFLFDGQHSAPIVLNAHDSLVVENNAVSIGTFKFIVGRLKKHNSLIVRFPSGRELNFPLKGSGKVIGDCPPRPSTELLKAAVAPVDQSTNSQNVQVAQTQPQFSEHPAIEVLQSTARYPDFAGRDRNFRTYRTRIRDGVDRGVNFAGHYAFTVIGCGTECKFGFVVDLRSGEVFDFPYGGEEHYQMDLRFDEKSRLVKVRWKGDWQSPTCIEKDLVVDGTSWRVLAERTVPTDEGLCFFPFDEVSEATVSPENTSAPANGSNSKRPVSSKVHPEWQTTCNANGFVVTPRSNPPIYLGKSCDAYHDKLGSGQWCWHQNGIGLNFPRGATFVDGLVLPSCAAIDHTVAACGCAENGQVGEKNDRSSPSNENPAQIAGSSQEVASSADGNSMPGVTRTVDSKGYVHHKLAECGFERGLAVAQYSLRTTDKSKRHLLELTDICFDRKTGTLTGSEPENRLTLVRKDEVSETSPHGQEVYEVILPGTQGFERWKLTAGDYEVYNQKDRQGAVGFGFDKKTQKQNNWALPAAQHPAAVHLNGYLFEELPNGLPDQAEYLIHINVLDLRDHLRNFEYSNGESPIAAWKGVVDLTKVPANLKLVTSESYEAYSKASGELSLQVHEDGTISGKGVLTASNTRLAGLNPIDWKTVRYDVEKLTGHIVGADGQQIRAMGIVRGERVDQDGLANSVYGYVSLHGYSRAAVEQWQDESSLALFRNQENASAPKDPKILKIEKQLALLGYDPGQIDGVTDDKTREAISRFQAAFGLPDKDELSPEQIAVLDALVNARSEAK